MKTMTCRQLGGACDEVFRAGTFDEMCQLSRQHGKAMLDRGDAAHIHAMKAMIGVATSPEAMQKWLMARRREFDDAPAYSESAYAPVGLSEERINDDA